MHSNDRHTSRALSSLLCAALCSIPSAAAPQSEVSQAGTEGQSGGWNRLRGPNGSGVVDDDAALPERLDVEDGLLWRAELPPGYGSPALTREHVFVTAIDEVTLLTFCFDRGTGEEVWSVPSPAPLEAPHRNVNSPAAASPATDGTNVYVFFERNGLLSYDTTGELRWQTELEPFQIAYGMGTSPVLAGDTLLLQADHDGASFLLALDKDTGEELWRTERPGATHGFSSPALYEPDEGPTEVVVSGAYQVAGYALETGEKLWWVDGLAWQAKCLPVVQGDMAYVNSWMASPTELGAKPLRIEWDEALSTLDADGNERLEQTELKDLALDRIWFLYDLDGDGGLDEEEWGYGVARATAKNGLVAIRLGGRGDVTESHVVWRARRALPNIPTPLLYDGLLYVLKEGGILSLLDPETGELVSDGRVEGAMDAYYASLVAGDGKLYAASQRGNLAVLEAGAEWSVTSVTELGEEVWATPALDAGTVYVRSLEGLYAFGADAATGTATEASAAPSGASQEEEAASAGDEVPWPGWRGPQRDGISRETSWSVEGAEAPLWRAEVGLGYSSVAVGGGHLFTLGWVEERGNDVVWALDAESGDVLWSHEFPAEKWDKFHGGGTNTTPTIDGDVIYTLNREGRLHCFEAATGVVRWEQDLVERYGVELPTWGFAASPVVVDDGLLVNVGRLLLLSKADGEERWVTKDYGHAYSTPALFEHDGRPSIALFNGQGLAVLDLSDGAERAFHEWKTQYDVNAATPVVIGDEIFISSGYNKGASMLKLGEDGLEPLWESRVMRTHMSGVVQVGEFLYGFDEAILKCIDRAGEVRWAERGLGKGSLTGAGDKLLAVTGDGELLVLAADPEGFRELSRRKVIDSGAVFWTMPVLADGLIYVRDSQGNLACLDHRAR